MAWCAALGEVAGHAPCKGSNVLDSSPLTTVFTVAMLAAASAALVLCAITARRWLASSGPARQRYAIELAWALVPLALLASVVAMLASPGNA